MGRKSGKKAISIVEVFIQKSEAYNALTASELKIYTYSMFLNYSAGTRDHKGSPQFKFTNKMAKDMFSMHPQVFTKAKYGLIDKGFWRFVKRGGLKGCNGVASLFELSSDWKNWTKPIKKKPSQVPMIGTSHTYLTGKTEE